MNCHTPDATGDALPRRCADTGQPLSVKQAPIAAYAFRAEITKWLALVRLLLSDIPDRAELAAPGLATALQPYFHLTNAVRTGSLATFQCVASVSFAHSRKQAVPPNAMLPEGLSR